MSQETIKASTESRSKGSSVINTDDVNEVIQLVLIDGKEVYEAADIVAERHGQGKDYALLLEEAYWEDINEP
jgi:hypothetical protein